MATLFKFDHEKPGFYRVYYRSSDGKHRYCIQNDGAFRKDNFVFYSCSRDGEPSCPLRMPMESSFDRKVLPASV
jgi:hypothetical protein